MRYKPFTFRLLHYLWHFKLAPAGRYVVYGIIFAGLGTISVQVPVYQIFCGLVALLGTAWVAGAIFRRRLALSGHFPETAVARHPVSADVTITNLSGRTAFDVMLGLFNLPNALWQLERHRYVPVLPHGESITVPVKLQPLQRGFYPLPELVAYSSFPFNLLRTRLGGLRTGSLLVLPEFHPVLEVDIPASSRYQPGGIALTSDVGESPEYIGNREYVPGEPARRLDFRSWARLGKPVVREYQEEYYCRIALILDTFVPGSARWRFEKTPDGFWHFGGPLAGSLNLEAAVSLAASVADALSNGEYIIDIFAAGPELYVFRAGRHTAHLENVLEILACVEACRRDPFETITAAVADELENISTAICVFLDWDSSRQRFAQAVVDAGCSLKVLIVRDGPTTEPISEIASGSVTIYSVAQIQSGTVEAL